MADRFDRFTEQARAALTEALAFSKTRGGAAQIGPGELLVGVSAVQPSHARIVLDSLGITHAMVHDEVSRAPVPLGPLPGPQLTPAGKKVIELAVDDARRLRDAHIGTEHLLLGIAREAGDLSTRIIGRLGTSYPDLWDRVLRLDRVLEPIAALQPEIEPAPEPLDPRSPFPPAPSRPGSERPAPSASDETDRLEQGVRRGPTPLVRNAQLLSALWLTLRKRV